MENIVPVTIHLNENLKQEFQIFFKNRGMSLDNAIAFVMSDFLNRYHIKDLNQMMDKFNLSKREKEVCLLVLKGYEIKTIADMLYIARDTVFTHVKNIYKKCGVKNKIQLSNTLNGLRYDYDD